MKHHRNNCKHSFIISAMGKIYEDNFDQNEPSYTPLAIKFTLMSRKFKFALCIHNDLTRFEKKKKKKKERERDRTLITWSQQQQQNSEPSTITLPCSVGCTYYVILAVVHRRGTEAFTSLLYNGERSFYIT